MKAKAILMSLLFLVGCGDNRVSIPDNRDLIDANTALIELNSELDSLLADRVSALETRMDAVEADVASINSELEKLGEETDENADAIANLRRKLRRHKREQDHINRVNAIQFRTLRASISSIQKSIIRLVKADRRLAYKLRGIAGALDKLRREIAHNSAVDLRRLRFIMSMFSRVSRELAKLKHSQISVVEGCDGLLLSTPEGLVGVVVRGEYQDVLYAQGDIIPGQTCLPPGFPFGGIAAHDFLLPPIAPPQCVPSEDRLSEGETVRIFVVSSVSLEYLDDDNSEDAQCEGGDR